MAILGAQEPRDEDEPLDEGDSVEVSISAYVKDAGTEAWFKAGAVTRVRRGEESQLAFDRAWAFTNQALAEAITEYKES